MEKIPCRGKSGNLEKMGKIREFYKNMSGKYQGIFSLFHNLKKITEMMLGLYNICQYDKNIPFLMKTILTIYICQTLQSFEHGQ